MLITCYFGYFLDLIDWFIFMRPEGPYIYRLVSHIHNHIHLHIYLHLHMRLHWYEPLCTDTSRTPEAYLHTPTAYQMDLRCEAHDASTHATFSCATLPSDQLWLTQLAQYICLVWGAIIIVKVEHCRWSFSSEWRHIRYTDRSVLYHCRWWWWLGGGALWTRVIIHDAMLGTVFFVIFWWG